MRYRCPCRCSFGPRRMCSVLIGACPCNSLLACVRNGRSAAVPSTIQFQISTALGTRASVKHYSTAPAEPSRTFPVKHSLRDGLESRLRKLRQHDVESTSSALRFPPASQHAVGRTRRPQRISDSVIYAEPFHTADD